MIWIDKFLSEVDAALRTLLPPQHRVKQRPSPAEGLPEPLLSRQEKKQIAGYMRVNHAGEICAQALYQGQALTAQLAQVKQQMLTAAAEEVDHLAWCEERLQALDAHTSLLNPLWYMGSFALGALAGMAGDKISLGFVAETEKQVTAHLQNHLEVLAASDAKTQAVLQQMQADESAHADSALRAGGITLPWFVRKTMHFGSKLMTKTSYYL